MPGGAPCGPLVHVLFPAHKQVLINDCGKNTISANMQLQTLGPNDMWTQLQFFSFERKNSHGSHHVSLHQTHSAHFNKTFK